MDKMKEQTNKIKKTLYSHAILYMLGYYNMKVITKELRIAEKNSKYYQNTSKGIKVMERTRMHLETDARLMDARLIPIPPKPSWSGG